MTGVFATTPTPTQSSTATKYSSESSVNSKRMLKQDAQSSSHERIIKKLKKEQTNDQEDDHIYQDDLTTQQSEFTLAGSPQNSVGMLSSEENITTEEKAPKRKRYGNWLREIVNHVCKLLKLRLLSLKSLSKVLNDHGNYHSDHSEHLDGINSYSLNLPHLSSDVLETFKHDRRAGTEVFMAFLEGFGKIKRNTYKMTEEYISKEPVFGERLVKAILEFIPETDQISTNSQYLNWITASTRMKKTTKDSLLEVQVRAALIRPLKKLYQSLCETNRRAVIHKEIDLVYSGSPTESKLLNETKDYRSNLNLIEDEGGGRDSPDYHNLRGDQAQGSKITKTEAPLKKESEIRGDFYDTEERNDALSKKEEESGNNGETNHGAFLKNPHNHFSYSNTSENFNSYQILLNLLLKQQMERLFQSQLQNPSYKGFGSDADQQELMKRLLRKLIEENRMNTYEH